MINRIIDITIGVYYLYFIHGCPLYVNPDCIFYAQIGGENTSTQF